MGVPGVKYTEENTVLQVTTNESTSNQRLSRNCIIPNDQLEVGHDYIAIALWRWRVNTVGTTAYIRSNIVVNGSDLGSTYTGSNVGGIGGRPDLAIQKSAMRRFTHTGGDVAIGHDIFGAGTFGSTQYLVDAQRLLLFDVTNLREGTDFHWSQSTTLITNIPNSFTVHNTLDMTDAFTGQDHVVAIGHCLMGRTTSSGGIEARFSLTGDTAGIPGASQQIELTMRRALNASVDGNNFREGFMWMVPFLAQGSASTDDQDVTAEISVQNLGDTTGDFFFSNIFVLNLTEIDNADPAPNEPVFENDVNGGNVGVFNGRQGSDDEPINIQGDSNRTADLLAWVFAAIESEAKDEAARLDLEIDGQRVADSYDVTAAVGNTPGDIAMSTAHQAGSSTGLEVQDLHALAVIENQDLASIDGQDYETFRSGLGFGYAIDNRARVLMEVEILIPPIEGSGEADALFDADVTPSLVVPADAVNAAVFPTDGQVLDVPTNPTLDWGDAANATGYDVYLSTNLLDVQNRSGFALVSSNQVASEFAATGLVPNQTYFWAVDSVNGVGVRTPGTEFTFTVESEPGAVVTTTPTNNDTDVDLAQQLSWVRPANADDFNVYFGTVEANVAARAASVFLGQVSGTTIDPGPLDFGTRYFFVVDSIGTNGISQSAVFSFTTRDPTPATLLGPADGATDIPVNQLFTWTDGQFALTAEILLSVNPVPDPLTDTIGSVNAGVQTFDPSTAFGRGQLPFSTLFYWQVRMRSNTGVSDSAIFSFTTEAAPPYTLSETPTGDAAILGADGGQEVFLPLDFDGEVGGVVTVVFIDPTTLEELPAQSGRIGSPTQFTIIREDGLRIFTPRLDPGVAYTVRVAGGIDNRIGEFVALYTAQPEPIADGSFTAKRLQPPNLDVGPRKFEDL